MKIFINIDDYNNFANKIKDQLFNICKQKNIEIVNNPKNADIICSIGGDGTFLKSARLSEGCPILGINCGTLGFLTNISPETIEKTINEIINGHYYVENRMMLEGEIVKNNGDIIKISPVLNDISIYKKSLGVIRFNTYVDGKLINKYVADGMIICTPTGSTAYNLSCGGPIVDPTAQIITLTPIAPHTVMNRSIILSENSMIEFKITQLRNTNQAYVLYDGIPIEVDIDDIIRIKQSNSITKIIKLKWQSFIDDVRENIN